MDKILEKAQELKTELDQVPLIIEYKRVRDAYENDEELNELKKQILRAKNENRMDDYKVLLDKFHNHPLYLNFNRIEEETKEYLREISNILNKK